MHHVYAGNTVSTVILIFAFIELMTLIYNSTGWCKVWIWSLEYICTQSILSLSKRRRPTTFRKLPMSLLPFKRKHHFSVLPIIQGYPLPTAMDQRGSDYNTKDTKTRASKIRVGKKMYFVFDRSQIMQRVVSLLCNDREREQSCLVTARHTSFHRNDIRTVARQPPITTIEELLETVFCWIHHKAI
jgi:hypothetical protein